jgi:hypothetical protein
VATKKPSTRKPGRKPLPPERKKSELVQTTCTPVDRERWERAAEMEGTTLSEEIRSQLNKWSARVLGTDTTAAPVAKKIPVAKKKI